MSANLSIDEALSRFGLSEFRAGQREVIDAVIAGRPTIAVLPTGAGKSLCYQLPAVALGGLTVVVSPLISLMKDQVDALAARGVPATFINSSVDPGEREARLRAALRGDLRLLYVAPERFRVASFAQELERASLTLLAVDEAHCISEWGHDFRPDYARLGDVVEQLRPKRLVALTATATPDVRDEIGRQLGMREPQVFVRGFDRPNLHLSVRPSGGDGDKLEACLALLDDPSLRARGASALIYTATRKKAEKVAEALDERGVPAAAYHAGLGDDERAAVQERWMAGGVRVIVATNAFGMGVDKRDVRLVIHHDLPGSAEAYYQEAGRAGRDGEPARCVLLFNHGDVRLREFLISGSDGEPRSPARIEAERERLRVMTSYAYARACRRRWLLGYFGDPARPEPGERCGGCDVCGAQLAGGAGAAELDDEEHLVVRKLLATVARLDGMFGRNRIALVLEGSQAKEVAGIEQRVKTFGLLSGRSHAFVLDLLGAVEAGGLLQASDGDYPTLRITAAGREVMFDRQRARISFPAERPERSDRKPRGAKTAVAVNSDETVDPALFEKLRALRMKLAQEERLPAYCVFHDRTLQELARARPGSLDELGKISGVGPMKLAKYGKAFLEALAG